MASNAKGALFEGSPDLVGQHPPDRAVIFLKSAEASGTIGCRSPARNSLCMPGLIKLPFFICLLKNYIAGSLPAGIGLPSLVRVVGSEAKSDTFYFCF